MIDEVLDGLAAPTTAPTTPPSGRSAARVQALCARFPIYAGALGRR